VNLDEALRLSPVRQAINMTLVAQFEQWGYQNGCVPMVVVPFEPDEFDRDLQVRVLRMVMECEIILPEIDGRRFVPVRPDGDLTPAERMHPDWEPVVTTDPVLNAAHLAQLDDNFLS